MIRHCLDRWDWMGRYFFLGILAYDMDMDTDTARRASTHQPTGHHWFTLFSWWSFFVLGKGDFSLGCMESSRASERAKRKFFVTDRSMDGWMDTHTHTHIISLGYLSQFFFVLAEYTHMSTRFDPCSE